MAANGNKNKRRVMWIEAENPTASCGQSIKAVL